jgi:DNA-binding protein HU-beta
MTKAQAIIRTAEITRHDRAQTDAVVSALIAAIIEALECGNAVSIPEFGRFHPLWRNETTGRLIREKTVLIVPAHFIPHFEPHSQFKHAVSDALKDAKSVP